ncbi:MAG: sulfatase [Verrucomicrobia bacterium]|nr:sulfatase [Verrucomicrobiota bacterium]
MPYKNILLFLAFALLSLTPANGERPNILFITVDDMNCDSVGVFGCELPDTTPNMDRLAGQGLRFQYAHVQVGNCMPGRNVMYSGLYSHNNGVLGFIQNKNPSHPHLSDLLQAGGYFTAIFGKVAHSTPYTPYAWDMDLDMEDGKKLHVKDPHSYYRSTKRGIQAGKDSGKPLYLNINVSDPHKPFYGLTNRQVPIDDPRKPSKYFTPEEVPIPGFLFDDPKVRFELAHYYMSVRRADDAVGEILRALDESGQADNTVVMLISDHGMALPWAKTALYHHSTHTPWMVRWPGKIKPNTIDDQHMISAVDLTPTLLDVAGIKPTTKFDGRSFFPILEGKTQKNRTQVFKEYNENSGGGSHPIRGVQNKRFLYLFNPWSDGKNKFKTATTGTLAYQRMNELAETDPVMAERLRIFNFRTVEELYDVVKDPDCRNNLVNHPDYRKTLDNLRMAQEKWMVKTKDPIIEAFHNRKNPEAMYAYVAKLQAESNERHAARRKAQAANSKL